MRRAGLTLLELLITMAGTALLIAAMFSAYIQALKVEPKLDAVRVADAQTGSFQTRITDILQHAYVFTTANTPPGGASPVNNNPPRTYFTTNPQANNTGLQGSSGGAGSASSSQGGGSGSGTSTLVFTALGEPTSTAAINDPSNDFNQQNQTRGAQGGMIEYAIETTPVGTAQGKQGVFLREQRPADADPTQGGTETLLYPDIDQVIFEFWDGTQWQPSWDTLTQTPVRLPAAVRITYSQGSATPTVFVVQIPLSDVTPANPATNIGGGQT
jgi:Tfp pilus assembly protein PilE